MAYNLVCPLCTQMIFPKWDMNSALGILAEFKLTDVYCIETVNSTHYCVCLAI